jgi:hypothetical protein
MNYKELIVEAANAENWDEVIRLGTDAKLNSSEETIFGIKRGYVNLFRTSRYYGFNEITKGLEDYGYKCYNWNLPKEVDKSFLNENYVVLFGTEELVSGLYKQGYQIQFFDIKHRDYKKYNKDTQKMEGNEFYYVNSDTQKFRFSKFSDLKGTLREQQIDSILDD